MKPTHTLLQMEPGEHRAKLYGLEIWYKIAGNGPVCVLPTHGRGCSAELYLTSMLPPEELFTMVYLETRGTGRSEAPPSTAEYTWEFCTLLQSTGLQLRRIIPTASPMIPLRIVEATMADV
jgi:pimeloyl-ACP methyl ester carboxylesterase